MVITNNAAEPVRWAPYPPCPRHPGGKIIRNGRYGKQVGTPRQRYRCTPDDGSPPHNFTPPLPRDHVHEGAQHCAECAELRGVHRGETAVARRHSWSTRIVARGLAKLAAGDSYTQVSQWALRVGGGGKRTRINHPKHVPTSAPKNAWHIAADWVEVFGPVIWAPIKERLLAHGQAERTRINADLAAGRPGRDPIVWLLDDVPVYARDKSGRSRVHGGYNVLVVAEMRWSPGSDASASKPVLRLARAMPSNNTHAWRLVFDELGYAPDFVFADAAPGPVNALAAAFSGSVPFIPCLWHIRKATWENLEDTPRAFTRVGNRKKLRPELDDHLGRLGRNTGLLTSPDTVGAWWDELAQLLVAANLPLDKVMNARTRHEPGMVASLPHIHAYRQLPLTVGGLESLINQHVQPVLAMRRAGFGNIERTNRLFDLVVARQHGAFDDLSNVAALLRSDSEGDEGFGVPLRQVADPRPKRGYYSSLRDTSLLAEVAASRGLT